MTNFQQKMFYAIILIAVTLLTTLVYFKGGLELVIVIGLIAIITNQITESNKNKFKDEI
jgi:hypothetical protein